MAITNNPTLKPVPLQLSTPGTPRTEKHAAAADSTPSTTAEDVTQQGLRTAQTRLDTEPDEDIDEGRVAEMQALLDDGEFMVDTDALASSMLRFFQP